MSDVTLFRMTNGSTEEFVGRRTNISIFGQESNPTTWRLTEERSCPD